MRASAWDEAARQFDRARQALALTGPDAARRAALLVELARAQNHAGRHAGAGDARGGDAGGGGRRPARSRGARRSSSAPSRSRRGSPTWSVITALQHALVRSDDRPLRARLWPGSASRCTGRRARSAAPGRPADAVRMARASATVTLGSALARAPGGVLPDRQTAAASSRGGAVRAPRRSGDPDLALPMIRQVGYLLELGFGVQSEMAISPVEAVAEASHDRAAGVRAARAVAPRGAAGASGRRQALPPRQDGWRALRDSTIRSSSSAQRSVCAGSRAGSARCARHEGQRGRARGDALRAAHARGCLEDGDRAAARNELGRMARGGLEAIPRDNVWLLAMAFLAETAAALDDRGGRERHRLLGRSSGAT